MAKKKTQFNKAKFNKKSGILSYNYLGGEAGKGRGAVSIVKQDGDWYFADKSGKIRTDVGINGKLTPTHMSNLERDGIFAAAEINKQGESLSKAEIKAAKANIGGDRSSDTISKGSGPVSRDNIPTTLDNEIIDRPRGNLNLEETNYQLAPGEGTREFTTSNFGGDRPGMRVSSNRTEAIVPDPATSVVTTDPNSTWTGMASTDPMTRDLRQGDYGSTFQPNQGAGQMNLTPQTNNNVIASNMPNVQTPRHINDPNSMMGPVYSSSVDPIAPGIDQKNLVIGEGGGTWDIDDSFYKQDGQIMKDSGWFGGDDTVATQADIDAGIRNQASPGMTSAEGWQAAGSIMKGVGGLASAYTGIKNYQLARDAFNTQKNQWQADYNQRLKAYEDNKQLANQEIEARNRTLAARGNTKPAYEKL